MNKGDLIGRWILASHVHINNSGVRTSMSDTASGMLIYGLDDSLSVLITKKSNPDKVNEVIAYSGNYTAIDSEDSSLILEHNIQMSLNENRKGTSEKRMAQLNDGHLSLETEKNDHGYYIVTWKRQY